MKIEDDVRIAVVPDVQVKPGADITYLESIGKFLVKAKPDVIVMIGDWWDMPSLSSYDKGKKSFEGRRYLDDIQAGNSAMEAFLSPIIHDRAKRVAQKRRRWNPRLVFTLGNHEERIQRAVEDDARLEGTIGYQDLNLSEWEVHPYLEVVEIEGVAFSHFFTSGVMGRPVSSARSLLTKKHQSCVMGHVQDREVAYARKANGSAITAIFSGICYEHDESYLNPQTNRSWRGVWILDNVRDGAFEEQAVSLRQIRRVYG